jgi:carboxylate-amine ligase
VIRDASHLWWDLRLNPLYGTIEIRIADAQTHIDDTTAIAALWQSLVAALLDRFDAGDPLPVHDTHRIAENRWRA